MQPTLTYGPIEIWTSMGTVGHLVLAALLLMSVASVAIAVDRWRLYRRAQRESLAFAHAARPLLEEGRLADLADEAARHPGSHLARIYGAVMRAIGPEGGLTAAAAEIARGAAERESVVIGQELKRGLSGLASIGATAPFVGLFGTVIGIMNSFFGMAAAGSGGLVAVAGGIAEALVNTAAGILVALPAVWAFNLFLGRLERMHSEMGNAGSELVDHLAHKWRSEAWTTETADRRVAGR